MGFWGSLGGDISNGFQGVTGTGNGDPKYQDYQNLNQLGNQSRGYAGAGFAGYNADTANMGATQNQLMGQMQGQNSVSAMQLHQGLQQQQAQQAAMAASASPQNAVMAARNAANNMGQAGYGLSGQQAMAGIAERNAAAGQLTGLQSNMRQQDLGMTQTGLSNANAAYTAGVQNAPKSMWQSIGQGLQSIL